MHLKGLPMELRTANGSIFQLDIVGYQFPELHDEEWDSNWLRIRTHVSLPEGSWSVTDPTLLTYEVVELADWLDAVANGNQKTSSLWFVEPNLEFEIAHGEDKEKFLRVNFAIELLPPWEPRFTENGGNIYSVNFPIAEVDLHAAAESLRAQLQRFPQRTEY
jgi:hypothetical protein